MNLFGLTITKSPTNLTPVPVRSNQGWLGVIRESFTGAWQRNVTVESQENLLAFSAVYACVSLIADDISKLRIKLLRLDDGIWQESETQSPFLPVLTKPNGYQTRIQFVSSWITSKLLYGNTYVYKRRDARGVVTDLYVLDPRLVWPMVTENGDVYYQLNRDPLSQVPEPIAALPAREIIHDRMLCLWHPLVGVPPIFACGTTATQGLRIQSNSEKFFQNMSRPSGVLSAPGEILDATAKRLKEQFERDFSGANVGRLLVVGDGLSYEPMTMPPEQAQLIEQLRWTGEDVARAFKVPAYKLGFGQPTVGNIAQLNQDYYSQTLQNLIECIEVCLDEGLSLPSDLGTELDLKGLLRMDPLSRAERDKAQISAGMVSPNEARADEDLPPVEGGDTPYLQQQNYSLSALAKRDARADPFSTTSKPAPSTPSAPDTPADPAAATQEDAAKALQLTNALLVKISEATHADF